MSRNQTRSFAAMSTGSSDEIKTSAENLNDSFNAIRSGEVDAVQNSLLIEQAATVSDIDHVGRTMLHIACSSTSKQELDVVRFLLEQGSGANVQDKRGNTALHNAARISGHEVVKLLLTFGCNALLRNADGQTPLGLAQAKARGRVTQVLRAHVNELTAVPNIPGVPRLIRSTDTSLIVCTTKPESIGGAEYPISVYDLRFSLRGLFKPWTIREGLNIDEQPWVVEDLIPGTDYVMSVRCQNRNGKSNWSNKSITMTTRSSSNEIDGKNGDRSTSRSFGEEGAHGDQLNHGHGFTTYIQSSSSSPPPPPRSESIETLFAQRNAAEERALKLQTHRTNAERAMLRIEREREAVSDQLKISQSKMRALRSTLRERDSEISTYKAEKKQRLLQEEQQRTMISIPLKDQVHNQDHHADLLRTVSKEEEYRLTTENEKLKERINILKSETRRMERTCREAEESSSVFQREAVALRDARQVCETQANEATRRSTELEAQVQQERLQRTEAEERVAEMSSIVGRLQRQRDAAEVMAEQLEEAINNSNGKTGDTMIASNSKSALETIAALREALQTSNRRVFELAGIESKCLDVTSERDSLLLLQEETELSKITFENELLHVREERDSLREQRDDAEISVGELREERIRLTVVLKEMKEIETDRMDNEDGDEEEEGEGDRDGGGGVSGGGDAASGVRKGERTRNGKKKKKRGNEEEELRKMNKLAEEREEILRQVLEKAAEEVATIMNSHREWLQKTEQVEQDFATRSGVFSIPDELDIDPPLLPPR